MTRPATPGADDVADRPLRVQLETFLEEHRAALAACLDGVDEQQARARLVSSATTLPGLVEHAVTGRSREELGLEAGPEESFALREEDTVATVRQAHRRACEASRRAVAGPGLDDLLPGNRRGPLPLRRVRPRLTVPGGQGECRGTTASTR